MFDEYPGAALLNTLGAYAILIVVLHPILLILLGSFGILLVAPTTSFGPSILEQYAPRFGRSVSIASFLAIGIGAVEVVVYCKIVPKVRSFIT